MHISQAVLVAGKNARLSIERQSEKPIIVSLLSEHKSQSSIGCYINMTQTLTIKVIGKGAEVHLSGHFEAEPQEEEGQEEMYGAENDDDSNESDPEMQKIKDNAKKAEMNKMQNSVQKYSKQGKLNQEESESESEESESDSEDKPVVKSALFDGKKSPVKK